MFSAASHGGITSFEKKKKEMLSLLSDFSMPVSYQQRFAHKTTHTHTHAHTFKVLERQLAITELHFSSQSSKVLIKFPEWLLSFFNSTLGSFLSFHSCTLLFSVFSLSPSFFLSFQFLLILDGIWMTLYFDNMLTSYNIHTACASSMVLCKEERSRRLGAKASDFCLV